MSDENTFPDLIREYHQEGKIDLLVSLCVAMKDQRDRAERKIDVLTHTIAKLNESFRAITEPATGRRLTEPTSDRADRAAGPGASGKGSPRKPAPKPAPPGVDTSDFQF